MRAWVDGVLLEGRSGSTSSERRAELLHDGAGDSVFTTLLLRQGRAFAWDRHLVRLTQSAAALHLGEVDADLLLEGARRVVGEHSPDRARLRLLWGRAPGGASHVSVQLSELHPPASDARVITPGITRTSGALLGAHKTTQYAENLVAAGEARRAGADEAVLLTEQGHISEGTGSNVFHVVDGELRTPSLATGCLPGVARSLVIEWCEVREAEDAAATVLASEEVFLTSSTREVQPVREWGGRVWSQVGPRTRAVQETWERRSQESTWWTSLRR